MSHDRNGTPLRVGDKIMIEYVITDIQPTEDYCNITALNIAGRKPDGEPEYFSGNAAVTTLVQRLSELKIDPVQDGEPTELPHGDSL